MKLVPTLCAQNLNEAQIRAFMLADNKFAERAGWNRKLLAEEIEELSILLPEINLDLSITGFEVGEIDVLLTDLSEESSAPEDAILPPTAGPAVTRHGEVWRLGEHRIICGDARLAADHRKLMADEQAAMCFMDPPYNVRIAGHVQGRGRVRHREFSFASGEMSTSEFQKFLSQSLSAAASVSRNGALHFVCIDWRHVDALIGAGRENYDEFLNLIVWNKTNAGQGSFYRSQHELIGLFRVGDKAHQNNIELGRHGRNRSNVWTYAGVNSFGSGRDALLAVHPTVKPVALVADAIKDCTSKGDLVLDPFLGSGTTILAAEKVGRRGRGIEFEPAYVDVAVRRWQAYTKSDAILEGDGRTFDEIAGARLKAAPEFERPPTSQAPSPAPGVDLVPDWIALCDRAVASSDEG